MVAATPRTLPAFSRPVIGAIVVALFLGMAVLVQKATDWVARDAAREEAAIARMVAFQLDQTIRAAKIVLAGAAVRVAAASDIDAGAATAIAAMAKRLEFEPQFLRLSILDPSGSVRASSAANTVGADGALPTEFFLENPDGLDFQLGYRPARAPASPAELVILHWIADDAGNIIALAELSLDLERLREVLESMVNLAHRKILAVRPDGIALFRFPDIESFVAGRDLSAWPHVQPPTSGETTGVFEWTSVFDGSRRIGGYAFGPDGDLVVSSARERMEVLSSTLLGAGQLLLIALTVLAIAILGALLAAMELRRRQRLIEERDLLYASLDLAEAGIAIAETTTENIVYVNRAFERISGFFAADILGKNCRILQGAGTDRATVAKIRAALDSGRSIRVDILNYTKDGKPFWSDLSLAPVRGADGKIRAYVSTFSDITERVEMTARLQASLARAQSADRAKSTFLARMSHELRTPLNAVIGFADMMSMRIFGPLDDRYARYAEDIGASGRHLLDLVERILELSRMEHDGRPLRADPVDLAEIAEQAAVLARGDVEAFGAKLAVARDGVALAPGDALALRQIAVNLIANAARHGKRGGCIVLRSGRARDGGAYLSIADDGPGLPASVLANLGAPFVGERSDTAGKGGLGLGLAISIELAKRMGGDLTVENAAPGVLATLTLPARARDSQAA